MFFVFMGKNFGGEGVCGGEVVDDLFQITDYGIRYEKQ